MEKLKKNLDIILGVSLLVLLVIYTIIIKFVGLQPVGPLGSSVGLGKFNNAVHDFIGVNFTLYTITDWLGLVAFAIILLFAIIGLVQWIKRKSLLEVDNEILALGLFYILVGIGYVFFEFVVINRRPVLIEGILEASYPSSTTMLSITVCLSAMLPLKKLITNQKINLVLKIALITFAIFMVGGRIISGVHWITDIIGGMLLSFALLFVYKFLYRLLSMKNIKSKDVE